MLLLQHKPFRAQPIPPASPDQLLQCRTDHPHDLSHFSWSVTSVGSRRHRNGAKRFVHLDFDIRMVLLEGLIVYKLNTYGVSVKTYSVSRQNKQE